MSVRMKIAGLMTALMALSTPAVWADSGSTAPAAGGDVNASADKGGDWHHGHEGHMMAKILNLSDDQVKQLKDSKEKQKTAMKSMFEQMKTNREAFDAEIVKAAPDMGKITDIQTQIKTLQSQMVDAHLNALLDIKKILSPEQFAGYMALEKEEHMKKHMMGHGKWGHKEGWGKDGDTHKNWGDKDKEEDEK